jgi:beta-lactamase regulating signal transducer with metallopeptidase domain
MNTFDVSRWLWDFYSWATVLLAVAVVANFSIAQPARRMVIAWSTAWALLALALLTAVPNWSQYSLVASQPPKQVEAPEPQIAPNAPPNFEQQSQQPQQQIAFPPPNMAAVETTPPNVITIDWSALAMTALVVGSSVVMCWLALGAWQVRRLCASASPAPDEINRLLAELSQGKLPTSQLGISQNLPVAVAVGLARPWILLPQTLTHANREQARSVLAHELAHVANRDLWLLAILRLLSILLWPHPLFWLLRRQVRLDQELLADAAAAELTSRGTYAEQLVALARSAVDARVPRLASSVGLWERPSQLTQRIALLLDDKLTILRNCSRSWRIGSAGMLAILALALSLVTLAPRVAQSRAESEATIIEETRIVSPEKFVELAKQSETTEGFADAVGDLIAAAIRPSQLPFVSEKRLAAIRYDFVMLVNEHTPEDITAERKTELLAGLRDHAQQHMRLWNKPITENRDLNSVYLDFNDRVKTLKWELWMALTRKPLDKEALATREAQRVWMRKTIVDQPKHRHYTHAKVLEDLEATFADSLCVIFDRPMSDEAFAKFKSEIESWLAKEPEPNSTQKLERDVKSGNWKPVTFSQLPFMVHHFLWEALIAQYRGEKAGFNGPSFDNDQIGGFGAGDGVIRLGFSSNHANESSSRSIDCLEDDDYGIDATTGYLANRIERRYSDGKKDKADFGFTATDQQLVALNGARLLPLEVNNWIEADAISVEQLKSRLVTSGVEKVDLGAFMKLKKEQFAQDFQRGNVAPRFAGAQSLDEALQRYNFMQDGEGPYVAVLTREGTIAVAHVTELRDVKPRSIAVRTRVRPKPVTDETVGAINAQAGPVAQVSAGAENDTNSVQIQQGPTYSVSAPNEISGRVMDEAGNPLAGVLVDAWTWYQGNENVTDDKGYFILKNLDDEDHGGIEVQFSKEGFCPAHFVTMPNGTENWKIELNSRTYLEGQVTGPDKEPIPHAKVRASRGPFENPIVTIGEVWTEIETDNEGKYRLYLEPDKYNVQVHVPGVGLARHEGTLLKDADHRKFDIQLQQGPTFRAKIVDSETGDPVEGVRLWNWMQKGIEGVSDQNGMLVIDNMLPGEFEFIVSASTTAPHDGLPVDYRYDGLAGDYARWWSPEAADQFGRKEETEGTQFQRNIDELKFNIAENMKPVTIYVEKAAIIKGRVVAPDGSPVVGATVAPAQTGTGNSLTGDTRYGVRSGIDGKFQMRLPASDKAKYHLVAHDGDYQEWRTWANGIGEPLQTQPGQEIENVELKLSQPCVVRGGVVDHDGNFQEGREVTLRSVDNMDNRYYLPTAKTNAKGEFEFRHVRLGKHHLQLSDGDDLELIEANPLQPLEGVRLITSPARLTDRDKFIRFSTSPVETSNTESKETSLPEGVSAPPADNKAKEGADDQTSWWIRPAEQPKSALVMDYNFPIPQQHNASYKDAIFSD